MIIYKDVPVEIFHKCWHIHEIGKKLHKNFTKDYGDIPVIRYNEITKQFESVDNHRGYGYTKRKDIKYRNNT